MPACDHKFIDSKRCIKCGWAPGSRDAAPGLDRKELERLARAAEFIEWWKAADTIADRASLHQSADEFIASASPSAVLALLEQLRELGEAWEQGYAACKLDYEREVGFAPGVGPVPNPYAERIEPIPAPPEAT